MTKFYFAICNFFLMGCALFMLSVTQACKTTGVLENNAFKKRDLTYQIGTPKNSWRRLFVEDADLAWINQNEDSAILVNSQCKDIKDLPLKALTVQLLIGMTEQNLISQTAKPSAGREALETILTAKIDGVLRKLNIFVFKKDGCVYDIVFSAPPQTYNKEVFAYEEVRNHFNPGNKK